MRDFRFYVPGIMLFLIAFVIVAVPEILVALVAGLMVMAAIGALYIGHMLRKSKIEFNNMNGWCSDKDPYGWHCVKESIFRRWH